MFEGKIALVTGGISGIGLEYVKELIRNGIQGVSIVDINSNRGKDVEDDLNKKFGPGKVLFLQADVSQKTQLKDAFESSFKYWNGLDIVINNAGVCRENDWEQTISVNCIGTVTGTFLGFEYMSTLKGGKGGVIVNISSIAGTDTVFIMSSYSATKSFVISFSRGVGNEYYFNHNHVKIVTICPGLTDTPIIPDFMVNFMQELAPDVNEKALEIVSGYKVQAPKHVAKYVITLINEAENGSVWVIEEDQPPYQLYEYGKSNLCKKL